MLGIFLSVVVPGVFSIGVAAAWSTVGHCPTTWPGVGRHSTALVILATVSRLHVFFQRDWG